jgi:hypothetical protein
MICIGVRRASATNGPERLVLSHWLALSKSYNLRVHSYLHCKLAGARGPTAAAAAREYPTLVGAASSSARTDWQGVVGRLRDKAGEPQQGDFASGNGRAALRAATCAASPACSAYTCPPGPERRIPSLFATRAATQD